MQIIRDILMTSKQLVTFKLTFESKDLNAHSLLSGLPESRRARVEEIITNATVELRNALEGEYDTWNSERR
jgi:hypothetical protein